MKKETDLKKIYPLKVNLEKRMLNMVREFEKNTNLYVQNIRFVNEDEKGEPLNEGDFFIVIDASLKNARSDIKKGFED